MIFQFLCLAAFGLPEIQAVHDKMQDQWNEFRGNTKEMLNQASIIVRTINHGRGDDSIDDLSGWAATHCHCGLSDDESTTYFLILARH
jgi:hypothetical protein